MPPTRLLMTCGTVSVFPMPFAFTCIVLMCMSWTKDASHKFESYFDALLLESDNFSFKKNMYNALIYIVIINFGNNN